jgi:hypothetical protein
MVSDSAAQADGESSPPRRKRRSASWRRLAAIVPTAALGLALLVLGVPRTIAAWEALAASPTLEKLEIGKIRPTDAELAEAVAGLESAIAWVPSGRRYADLAFLEVEQVLRLPPNDVRRKTLLVRAEQHLIDGLSANPADGFAWLRLAIVRELSDAPPRQIALALAQSLDVAPNVRQLWLPRATMLLAYWRYLTVDEVLAMRAQLRTVWVYGKALRLPLLHAADRLGQAAMISWGIGDDPSAQAELAKLQENLPKLMPR